MKILIIGANGTIGKKVTTELSKRHEILTAGRTSGDITVDISSELSIEEMYSKAGKLDGVVCTAGEAYFGDLHKMREENVYVGIKNKLMGQVNIVLIGQHLIDDGGSFTLTSGILYEDPIKNSAAIALVNGALNSFVIAAAQEMRRGLRINVVCPGLVEDSSESMGPFFPGHIPVPMNKVVSAYVKSVEGLVNGQIIKIY